MIESLNKIVLVSMEVFMEVFYIIMICVIAGLGAGLGTGFAGMSAAAVISPMLIIFLDVDAYMAVGIALASDVVASAISAYTYGKNKNLDIKNGLLMLVVVLLFTVIGSYLSSLIDSTTLGNFSVYATLILGLKFLISPNNKVKIADKVEDKKVKIIKTVVVSMVIGFICGFVGAGGGIMMLLILTSIMGYELKTAVGTSVFVMSFTALTGATSHFVIAGAPDFLILGVCMVSTLVFAKLAALFANKATPTVLNRITGVVLTGLGVFMVIFQNFF